MNPFQEIKGGEIMSKEQRIKNTLKEVRENLVKTGVLSREQAHLWYVRLSLENGV